MHIVFNMFYGMFIGLLILLGGLFLVSLIPAKTGIEMKIVQSGSMAPAIPMGALVVVRPSASYNAGDIITFGEDTNSAVPTTHRILSVRKEGSTEFYVTKGDANEEADPQEVAKRDIIGKVFFSLPYAGYVLDFAKQPLGFALLIGAPAFLVIVSEFAAIVYEVREMQRRRVAPAPRLGRRPHAARNTKVPPSIEYVRPFAMDDIFVPVRIFADSTGSPQEKRIRCFSTHYKGALASTIAVVCIWSVASLSESDATLSYFRDTETSTGNTFAAGSGWELSTSLGVEGSGLQVLAAETPQDTEEMGEEAGLSGEEVIEEAPVEQSTPEPAFEESVTEVPILSDVVNEGG